MLPSRLPNRRNANTRARSRTQLHNHTSHWISTGWERLQMDVLSHPSSSPQSPFSDVRVFELCVSTFFSLVHAHRTHCFTEPTQNDWACLNCLFGAQNTFPIEFIHKYAKSLFPILRPMERFCYIICSKIAVSLMSYSFLISLQFVGAFCRAINYIFAYYYIIQTSNKKRKRNVFISFLDCENSIFLFCCLTHNNIKLNFIPVFRCWIHKYQI